MVLMDCWLVVEMEAGGGDKAFYLSTRAAMKFKKNSLLNRVNL